MPTPKMPTIQEALARFEAVAGQLDRAVQDVRRAVAAATEDWEGSGSVRMRLVVRIVAGHFGIPVELLRSRIRRSDVALARMVAMVLAREAGEPPTAICTAMCRDWSTLNYAQREIRNRESVNPDLAAALRTLRQQTRTAWVRPGQS